MDAQEQVGRIIITSEVDAGDEVSLSTEEWVQGCMHERKMNFQERL